MPNTPEDIEAYNKWSRQSFQEIVLNGNLGFGLKNPPQSPVKTPEEWNGYQINYGDLLEKLFGKYYDKSSGLLAAEGKAIENAVAALVGVRPADKRIKLTDHYSVGQTTLGQVLYKRDMNGPELIAKFIRDCGEIKNPRWQQQVCINVYSPTGKPAGFFGRKFDLVTDGIFEIKSLLPTDDFRIKLEFAIMSICWPILKRGKVERLNPFTKFKFLGPGEAKSFHRITPKIGPTYALVAPNGIITADDINFNMRMAKEIQQQIYEELLEMLKRE